MLHRDELDRFLSRFDRARKCVRVLTHAEIAAAFHSGADADELARANDARAAAPDAQTPAEERQKQS